MLDTGNRGSATQPGGWLATAAEFFRNLFDLEFRQLLTPRMLPVIYAFAILAVGLSVLTYVFTGFLLSAGEGILRLLLIGPLAFLMLVTLVRVALEFCLAVFRIAVHVNKMAGHTEEIAGGLPRIQFWKPFRRRDEDGERQ
jgi:hypothetical protein